MTRRCLRGHPESRTSAIRRSGCSVGAVIQVVSAAAISLGLATDVSAHAFVQRYDLPVPFWYYLVGAGVVVGFTFVMLAALRTNVTARAPLEIDISHRWIGRLASSTRLHTSLRGISFVIFIFLVSAGLLGAQEDPFANILPGFVWVVWWVGFGFLCALVGDVWPVVNPWATVANFPGRFRNRGMRPSLPPWLGVWPAVALYLCFAWAELVWPDNAVPTKLATVILVYSAITWAGMVHYGTDPWLRCGETFSVVFGLFGRFAPLAKSSDGRLVVRLPGTGLAVPEKVSFSMVVFVVALLATVSFDGFLHTAAWGHVYAWAFSLLYDFGWVQWLGNTGTRTLIVTAGLVAAPLCFLAVFLAICQCTAIIPSPRPASNPAGAFEVASRFAFTLVPIAIAYHLAHYLWLLIIEGQRLYGHISDPLGLGWNLFGTAGVVPDSTLVEARFLWLFALVAIVVGHAIAVWLAHLAAQRAYGNHRAALVSQIPMLFLMIGYTVLSLWIIGQPIVAV